MQKNSSNVVPKKLLFEIGGYDSLSFKIELKGNTLEYNEGFPFAFHEAELFKPTNQEWKQLRKVLDKLRIWNWSKEYESGVLDGTQWSFEVSYEDDSIKSYGNNAYPDPENTRESVVLEYTEPFIDLINALRNITNEDCFNVFE